VPPHPLAAVPAATCARQRPALNLFRGHGGNVVHVLEQARPLCQLRVRRLDRWEGAPPLRLCALCAAALAGNVGAGYWQPTRVELGDLHLHTAQQLVAAVRERLADVRSAAIYDGSAMVPAEALPTYRQTAGIPDDQPVPSLRTALILGEVLDRVAPPAPVQSPTQAAEDQARLDAAAAARQRATDRTVAASAGRREDLRAGRRRRAR
jgi:hypothetical protein